MWLAHKNELPYTTLKKYVTGTQLSSEYNIKIFLIEDHKCRIVVEFNSTSNQEVHYSLTNMNSSTIEFVSLICLV